MMHETNETVSAPDAVAIVHWPGKSVAACQAHVAGLLTIGAAMGIRPAVEMLPDWGEPARPCTNCENLLKQGKPLPPPPPTEPTP